MSELMQLTDSELDEVQGGWFFPVSIQTNIANVSQKAANFGGVLIVAAQENNQAVGITQVNH